MTVAKLTAISTVVRWVLELLFVWVLVLPETGTWTCIVLTLMTFGIECNFFLIQNIQKAGIVLADSMIEIHKPKL